MRIHDGEIVGSVTMYYDPFLDVHMPSEHEPSQRFATALWMLPYKPDDARVLVEDAIDLLKWRTDAPVTDRGGSPRETNIGMFFAREFGDDALYAKLKAHSEANYEPSWDTASGEFTWRFGLDETYPRGQYNATAALAEAATEDAWRRLFAEPNLRKFVEPAVTGVDFPNVCLSQAVYDVDRRCLIISSDKGVPAAAGKPTTFCIINVDPDHCTIVADGVVSEDWCAVEGDIEVSTTVGEHTFVVRMN